MERYKKQQPTNSKNIKDFFVKKELLDVILSAFNNGIDIENTSLDNKIYIKDDLKAVYTIYGNTWSECFRISIRENELQIELINQIQE